MKYTPHTIAVDVWAAGIILISILTRRYPFFKSQDDNTALGHIATIFGTDALQGAARAMNKKLTCQPYVRGFEIKELCRDLRGVCAPVCKQILADKKCSQTDTPITPRRSSRLRERDMCSPELMGIESSKPEDLYTDEVYDLVKSMLSLDPHRRMTAFQALEHPFFKTDCEKEKGKAEE